MQLFGTRRLARYDFFCPPNLTTNTGKRRVESEGLQTVTGATSLSSGPDIALSPGYPNPFALATRLRFRIPEEGPVRITVYDVTGRRVRSVVDERLPAGDHEAVWDGRNGNGRAVGAGVYFSVLEYGGTRRTRRLVVRP